MGDASGRPKREAASDGALPGLRVGARSAVSIGVARRTSSVRPAPLWDDEPEPWRSALESVRPTAGGGVLLVAITGWRVGRFFGRSRAACSCWLRS